MKIKYFYSTTFFFIFVIFSTYLISILQINTNVTDISLYNQYFDRYHHVTDYILFMDSKEIIKDNIFISNDNNLSSSFHLNEMVNILSRTMNLSSIIEMEIKEIIQDYLHLLEVNLLIHENYLEEIERNIQNSSNQWEEEMKDCNLDILNIEKWTHQYMINILTN